MTPVAVDICVCTFRRAHLASTLASLGRLTVPEGVLPSIIVADNDTVPSAEDAVARFAARSPLPVAYIHCPAGNISLARNACLGLCTGDYAAFIDDDEVASPGWLAGLMAAAEREGADIVLGPVEAHYRPDAPDWLIGGDLHATRPVWVKGRIRTGYTCNVLFRREGAGLAGRRFDLALGQSGGEDTDFFHLAVRDGARIAYAPDAEVSETVPPERATLRWLLRRRFRMGQTHGRLIARTGGMARRLAGFAPAVLKVGYCAGAALAALAGPRRRNAALLRGVLHLGTVSGLLGFGGIRQYGLAAPAGDAACPAGRLAAGGSGRGGPR